MKFDVDDKMMAAISSIENDTYKVQQEAKQDQLTLMDTWKKLTGLHFKCNAVLI
jgi:hypothetical protein